jgi:hypothetical protein
VAKAGVLASPERWLRAGRGYLGAISARGFSRGVPRSCMDNGLSRLPEASGSLPIGCTESDGEPPYRAKATSAL